MAFTTSETLPLIGYLLFKLWTHIKSFTQCVFHYIKTKQNTLKKQNKILNFIKEFLNSFLNACLTSLTTKTKF